MKPLPATVALSGVVALCFVLAEACGGSTPKEQQPARAPVPHKVLLEIDQMKDTPALEVEQLVQGVKVSLKSIYAEAGVELDVRHDQLDVPRQDEVSQADLHAMMSAFRSIQAAPDVMHVHALVLTRERETPDTLGNHVRLRGVGREHGAGGFRDLRRSARRPSGGLKRSCL